MKNLNRYCSNFTSQNGEDGVLRFLCKRIGIEPDGWCCEFGAWDGIKFSNTYILWSQCNLNAVLIESDVNKFKELRNNTAKYDRVYIVNATVANKHEEKNSLDNILNKFNIPRHDIDILSIDVDGYEYSIWQSVCDYKAKIVVIEVNPYQKPHVEFIDNITNEALFLGTTPKPMVQLGKDKGYELVAHLACNLIFVRKDLFPLIRKELDSNILEDLYDYTWVR